MKAFVTLLIAIGFCFVSRAGELFIQVTAPGVYYATVSNQVHYNQNNIFRFFDLESGYIKIQTVNQTNNNVLYNGSIYIENDERVIAQINTFGSLSIIKKIKISIENWYTTIESDNGQGTPNHHTNPPSPWNNPNANNQHDVNNSAFQKFLTVLKNESYDSNRLKTAKSYISKSTFSAEQIAEMSKTFSYDSGRLDFAKVAYNQCVDKNNYFLLRETFSYPSGYSSLLDYIDEQ